MERRQEWRRRRMSRVCPDTVDLIRTRVDLIPAHDGHQPRVRKVIRFHEAAAELHRIGSLEADGQREIRGNQRNQVLISAMEVLSKQIEGTIIKAEVATHAIEWLTSGDHSRSDPIGFHTRGSLHRTSIKVKHAQREISVIVRSRRSRRLDFVPAGWVTLQVEAVGKAAIQILEVGIRNECHLRRNISWARGRAASVLVHDGNGVVIAAVSVPAAELYALGRAGESEGIIDILGGGAEVRLIVNVPPAQVPAARRAEGQVEFELPDAHAQGVGRQLEEAADIDKLQGSVA